MTIAQDSPLLYNRTLLALAVESANYPPLAKAMLCGSERSPLCGSHIALSLNVDSTGRVVEVGLQIAACAIGQAAAVLFARHARGKDAVAIEAARDNITTWLAMSASADSTDSADSEGRNAAWDSNLWPEIGLLAPARTYPARHGAILLAFNLATHLLNENRIESRLEPR